MRGARRSGAGVALAWVLSAALALGPSAAWAQDEGNADLVPGPGAETERTRTGPDFLGMGFLFPVRLHFSRGGFLDGKVGGYDAESGQVMLVLPETKLRIETSLVRATTPLGVLPEPGSAMAARMPPALVAADTVYKMKPTWRSGLGLALNVLAPGTGSFLQKKEKGLGFLFLGLDLFFVGAGLLAVLAPSQIGTRERTYLGVVFFSFDALVRGAGGGQAFVAGRERTLVPGRPAQSDRW